MQYDFKFTQKLHVKEWLVSSWNMKAAIQFHRQLPLRNARVVYECSFWKQNLDFALISEIKVIPF